MFKEGFIEGVTVALSHPVWAVHYNLLSSKLTDWSLYIKQDFEIPWTFLTKYKKVTDSKFALSYN